MSPNPNHAQPDGDPAAAPRTTLGDLLPDGHTLSDDEIALVAGGLAGQAMSTPASDDYTKIGKWYD